jgi:hypothetical protein
MSRPETARSVRQPGHSLAIGLIALGVVLALAACGFSSPSPTAAVTSAFSKGAEAADCMRSHGVPNFPDPGAGGGIQVGPGSGINPSSPAFRAAASACKLGFGGGHPATRPSEQAITQMLMVARCMRRHRVPDFPDPTYSQLTDQNHSGLMFAIPNTINRESPAFRQAETACMSKH